MIKATIKIKDITYTVRATTHAGIKSAIKDLKKLLKNTEQENGI